MQDHIQVHTLYFNKNMIIIHKEILSLMKIYMSNKIKYIKGKVFKYFA